MRFLILVDEQWRVAVTCPPPLNLEGPKRRMQRLNDPETGGIFPLPPASELAGAAEDHPAKCRRLCRGDVEYLSEQRQRIVDRDLDETGVSPFGAYLFHSLIGPDAWKWIKDTAAQHEARHIELALRWASEDTNLNRLNWEMMHDGRAFLAAGLPGVGVAITRLVAGTGRPDRSNPPQLDFPPRVLFVVGTTLDDKSIRPGAEYLGLLRQLKESGRRIHARVLEEATPSELDRVVCVFKPDVVHFVCHGNLDPDSKRGYLELMPDTSSGDRACYADQLYAALTPESMPPPTVVVLSACHSGSAESLPAMVLQGVHETAPLATELIDRGVPIVLAMAGRVSDRACRLFTRRFGDTLIAGDTLVTATAEARRATVSQGNSAESSVDWAFPALFLAEAVDEDYRPLNEEQAATASLAEEWITGYDLELLPVFFGRNDFFQAYYSFFSPDPKRVLAAVAGSDAGVGKTRLLQELAAQALRDGQIPIPFTSEKTGWAAPATLGAFADQLRAGIRKVRKVLKLAPDPDSQLRLLSRPGSELGGGPSTLDEDIMDALGPGGELTGEAVRLAAQLDLFRLAKDARAQHEPIQRAEGRVLVLFDSLEKYPPALLHQLFDYLLDAYGLGNSDEPVPIVVALALQSPTGTTLQELLERHSGKGWLRQLPLLPFRIETGEDLAAYASIVLNPFVEIQPGLSDRRFILNDRVSERVAGNYRNLLIKQFNGSPVKLASPTDLYSYTEYALGADFVVKLDSDDDDLVALKAAKIQAGRQP